MKYFLTYHAIERLKERFPAFYNKVPDLKSWKREHGVNKVKNIFDKLIEQADENRSYINNTTYMLKLYDKYGYDVEYCFKEYKEENILFIFTKNRSEVNYKLVTLMPTEYRPTVKNLKYNAKQTKEDKHNKLVMDFYDSLGLNNKNYLMKEIEVKNELPKLRKQYEESKSANSMIKEETFSNVKVNQNGESLNCSQELAETLFKKLSSNNTKTLQKFSSTRGLYQCVIDDKKYEFIYQKSEGGKKIISLKSMVELSQEEKDINNLQNLLTPELKKALLNLVYDNATVSEKISNSRSMHTADYNGLTYHFLVIKTSVGERNIVLQKTPVLSEVETKNENLISYTEVDNFIDVLTPELKEKLVSLIFNNATVSEKISNSRSLHTAEVDGFKYHFLAVKKIAGDRNIILQELPSPIQTKEAVKRIKM